MLFYFLFGASPVGGARADLLHRPFQESAPAGPKSVFPVITSPPLSCLCPLQLGLDMEELQDIEEDAGLGNGGLGRLAGELDSPTPTTPCSVLAVSPLVLSSLVLVPVPPPQLASWTPWPLWAWLPMDMESAMNSASSTRRSSAAGRFVHELNPTEDVNSHRATLVFNFFFFFNQKCYAYKTKVTLSCSGNANHAEYLGFIFYHPVKLFPSCIESSWQKPITISV